MAQTNKAAVVGVRSSVKVPQGGFVRANLETGKALVCSVDGLEKQGKDHFGLTGPGPVCIISTDIGVDGVVQKFQKVKEIYIAHYRLGFEGNAKKRSLEDMQEIASICDKTWSNITRDYHQALDDGARTIICDTGTDLWEILRMARFGKLTQVMPHHYGPVNAEFDAFIKAAYDDQGQARANVIFLHKLKEEWKNGADGKGTRTGEYKRAGFAGMAFAVQVNAVVWRDAEDPKVPSCFHCTIQDCRHDPSLNQMDLQGEECNFPTLAAMVLGADVEDFT